MEPKTYLPADVDDLDATIDLDDSPWENEGEDRRDSLEFGGQGDRSRLNRIMEEMNTGSMGGLRRR